MALEITKTFVVDAEPTAVWAFLTDVRKVAQCMPGANIGEQIDEKTWAGTMKVKVGPVTSSYKGKVAFESLDADALRAEIVASGQDTKGKGGADMRMTSQLVALAPGRTEVTAVSKLNVSGILAQMGRGMIEDVSDQIFQVFTQRARSVLEAAAGVPSEPRIGTEAAAPEPAPAAPEPSPAVAEPAPPRVSEPPAEPDLTATLPETPALRATAPGAAPVRQSASRPAVPASPVAPPPRRTTGSPGALPSGGWAPARSAALDAAVERLESAAGQLEAAAARLEAAQARLSGAADRFDAALAEHRALVDAGKSDVLDLGPIGARAFGRAAVRQLKSPIFWVVVVVLAIVLFKLFDT